MLKDLPDSIGLPVELPPLPLEVMRVERTLPEALDEETVRRLLRRNHQEQLMLTQKMADRLKEYVKESGAGPGQQLFPISYNAARIMVRKAGRLVGIHLRPQDLRRHAATFASRSGTPIEIVSKVIMRHAHLSTTQRYLGKVTDVEAVRWIENLYG
jgi:site-specific recombinase XerC